MRSCGFERWCFLFPLLDGLFSSWWLWVLMITCILIPCFFYLHWWFLYLNYFDELVLCFMLPYTLFDPCNLMNLFIGIFNILIKVMGMKGNHNRGEHRRIYIGLECSHFTWYSFTRDVDILVKGNPSPWRKISLSP